MGGYLAYTEYKPSKIKWLDSLPIHWNETVIKFYYDVQLGKMLQPQPSSELDEEVDYLKAFHVQWNRVVTEDLPKMWASPNDREKYKVENGDLLICEGGEVGRTALLNNLISECIIQNALHRVRASEVASIEYLNYLMRHIANAGWFNILCSKSTIAHLTCEKLGALELPLAPIEEQRSIARFLDYKTAQIDALIAKKETLLKMLAEKRTALISQAVTKGCDRAVPMKDSGVEWLGEIPVHWKVTKLSYVSDLLQTGPFGSQLHSNEYVEGGIPVINPADIYEGELRCNPNATVTEEVAARLTRHKLEVGDIVIGRRGEMGRAGLVKHDNIGWLCGTGSLRACLKKDSVNPYYLLSQFSLSGVSDHLSLHSVGSTMDNLNTSILGRLSILLPPLSEQQTIADAVQEIREEISITKSKIQDAIAKLKEYRTALITNAVTGKIDVRDVIPELEPLEVA